VRSADVRGAVAVQHAVKWRTDGFGVDQLYAADDLGPVQDGTVLLTVEGGGLYSRIDNVTLVVGGTSLDADAIAPDFYERCAAAIEAC